MRGLSSDVSGGKVAGGMSSYHSVSTGTKSEQEQSERSMHSEQSAQSSFFMFIKAPRYIVIGSCLTYFSISVKLNQVEEKNIEFFTL